jgi:hypothetical protein
MVKRMAHYDQSNASCVKNWEALPVETRGSFDSLTYNVGMGCTNVLFGSKNLKAA